MTPVRNVRSIRVRSADKIATIDSTGWQEKISKNDTIMQCAVKLIRNLHINYGTRTILRIGKTFRVGKITMFTLIRGDCACIIHASRDLAALEMQQHLCQRIASSRLRVVIPMFN